MTYQEAMREARARYFRELLEQTGGSVAKAAARAGVNRSHFYVLLERSGIPPPRHGHRSGRGGNAAWRSLAQ